MSLPTRSLKAIKPMPAPKRTSKFARRMTAANTERTCVGCRRRSNPEAFVRIAAGPQGLRIGRNEPGRGAWICNNAGACLDAALQRGALARALRQPVSVGEGEALRATLIGS
ncbi:MAG: YlxR family protein [Acidimicrobiia bacterium]